MLFDNLLVPETGRLISSSWTSKYVYVAISILNHSLTNGQMPYMDGIQATKEIRALGFSYPIIGLSAGTSEQADACIAAGMNHFVPKPIDREKLKKVVKTFYVPTTIPEVDETALPSPSPRIRSNSEQNLGTFSSNGYGSSSSTVL